jgi:hypothetical protein
LLLNVITHTVQVRVITTAETLRESKMFNSIINAFKATPPEDQSISQVKSALAERMDHMMRMDSISARIIKLEVKNPVLVKDPRSILLKKSSSLRKAFAA